MLYDSLTYVEGTSSISIDLVHRDRHSSTRLHLGDLLSSQGILGVLADVDVTLQLCPSALIDDVCCNFRIPDQGSILLAWADGSAIPWERLDHCKTNKVSKLQGDWYNTWSGGRDELWKPKLAGEFCIPWALRTTAWLEANATRGSSLKRIDIVCVKR